MMPDLAGITSLLRNWVLADPDRDFAAGRDVFSLHQNAGDL
jgi:hypothetical protein